MTTQTDLGGSFTLTDGPRLARLGYGAMQLAGPGVFGPPRDRAKAVAVLRDAIAAGINHIDTSDFYGPHITNEIIREALHPYPDELCLVTKVGARRDDRGGWLHAHTQAELRSAVQDNLRNLQVEALDVVNLRVGGLDGPEPGSIAEMFGTLAQLREQGLIRQLGVSNVTGEQIAEAQAIAPVACVQNLYNVAHRADDRLIDSLAQQGVAYVPFFPLGGFTPLQHEQLDRVAAQLDATPMQVALAWLLQRSPNILLIPGTSSREHLHQNIAAATLTLPEQAIRQLDTIAGQA